MKMQIMGMLVSAILLVGMVACAKGNDKPSNLETQLSELPEATSSFEENNGIDMPSDTGEQASELTKASVSDEDNNRKVYDVKLTALTDGSILLKDGVQIYNFDRYTTREFDNPERKAIKVGKCDITADLVEVKQFLHGGEEEIYLSTDKNVEYIVDKRSDRFRIRAENDTVLAHFDEMNLTGELLNQFVKTYLSDYLPDINYDEYAYSCVTTFDTVDGQTTVTNQVPYCYVSGDSNQRVRYYEIEFRKYSGGVKTTDTISVRCDERGNITRVSYSNNDVDWTVATFDPAEVDESVSNYLNEIVREGRELVSYSVEHQVLDYEDGEFQLALTLELRWLYDGVEYESLCAVEVEIS